MKPKHNRLRVLALSTLPSLIIFTAMIPLAHAGTINPDPNGNVTIPPATNQASTINASGGLSATPVVTIPSTSSVTGDAVIQIGANVTAPNYTINNSGILSGNFQGVLGNTAASPTLKVNNFTGATIQGNNGAISFLGAGGSVYNAGTINGSVGVGSNGISGQAGLTVDNLGTITGIQNGVIALGQVDVFNDPTGQITGGVNGLSLGANAFVQNDGLIQGGTGSGVTVLANGQITNSSILEGNTGITTVGASTITNSGFLTSTAVGGLALNGGAGADIVNLNLGSLVTGELRGGAGANTLVLDGGRTSPSSLANEINGSVTGFAVIKNGTGLATIGRVSEVSGGLVVTANSITVNGGALYINANVASPTINAGGTAIGGTGNWVTALNVNAGGFSAGAIPINLDANPENSVGRVGITGPISQAAGTFIREDIVPDTAIIDGTNSDIIEQFGNGNAYNLNGAGLRISSTNVNKVITAGTYTLIDSDAPIVGNIGTIGIQFNANIADTGAYFATGSGANYADSVFTNYFTTLRLTDSGTNLVLDVNYRFRQLPSLTPNQASLGNAFDQLALQAGNGSLSAPAQDYIAALSFSNLGAVQSAFSGIIGGAESVIGASASIINSNYRLHRQIEDRLAMSRSGETTMSVTSASTMDAKGGMIAGGTTNSTVQSRGNVWGTFSYDHQEFQNDSFDDSSDVGAFTAGFDYRIAQNVLMGILLDGSKSNSDNAPDVDSFRVALYGTYGAPLGIYVDMLAGYGTHDLNATDARSFQALATMGYAMGNEQFKHGPFIGAEYQNLEMDGFQNNLLSVNDSNIDSFRGLVGYRVNAQYGNFKPYASVAYAHEFQDDQNTTNATIFGQKFGLNAPRQGSAVLVTLGTGINFTSALSMDIGYRGELSTENDGVDSHGGQIGLNYSF